MKAIRLTSLTVRSDMFVDERYMRRALQLARNGLGDVSPNPMVGAVIVAPDGTVIANDRLTTPADRSASYAYCSDTVYNPAVADDVRGVDVLYHESTYADDFAAKAAPRGHSTAREAGRIAAAAGVGRLVLGHYSKAYDSEEPFLREASEEFPDVIAAREGMKIDLL